MHVLSLALIHIIPVIFARAAVFTPNCSLPEGNETPTYVSGPQVRSTLTILWSSLGTIILCTWTILHLSVPAPQGNISNRGWCAFLYGGLGKIWRKLKWMLVALFMPEFLVGKSLGEFVSAWNSSLNTTMKDHAQRSGIKWTMTHAYFANMGGYVLHEGDNNVPRNPPPNCRCCSNNPGISDVLNASERWSIKLGVTKERILDNDLSFRLPIAINAAQLCRLMDGDLIIDLPRLSKEDIEDKSKGDVLVKLWTLLQIVWLIVELIVRKVSGLSSSQLEITALSFSVCASITYLLLLPKPKDVMIPERILTNRPLNNEDKRAILSLQEFPYFGNALFLAGKSKPQETVPNDVYNTQLVLWRYKSLRIWEMAVEDMGFMLGAIVFGAVHVLAWNFEFPSPVEQTLWRVTSVATAVIIPFYYAGTLLITLINAPKWVDIAYSITMYVLYIIARLFIIVEVLRSLGYLHPDAFVTTWSGSIPHLS
ncbi:hypothetical protein CHU98_g7219 [Xylaria longipes]|nr:hypothetical protein CHU98_g7219 [Xylaria longipes]